MDMSDIDGLRESCRARSGLYAQLSEFFKEPSAGFAEDVASGRLARFFEERLGSLGLDTAPCEHLALQGDVLARLKAEYRQLFAGPLPPYVVPVESIYKRWTTAPDCHLPFAAEKGHLMGDAAVDMQNRYRDGGLAIPDEFVSMPDHVALELEYLSGLALRGDEVACREFLARRLDWLDDLARDIEGCGKGGFYVAAAGIARDVVRQARSDA
jgi:TorA maturation chaperone TorD